MNPEFPITTAPTSQSQLWHTCLGREDEIDSLLETWQSVNQHSEPRWINIVADSGWGKTRLIHEFYEKISLRENASEKDEGYWPDHLAADPTSMTIEPQLSSATDCGTPIPWLWLGLRWIAPNTRNRVQTGTTLHEVYRQIQPHLAPLLIAKTKGEAKRNVIDNLVSLFLKVVPYGDLINETRSGGKTIQSLLKNLREIREARANSSTSLADRHEMAERGIQTKTADLLSLFLDRTAHDLPTVPVILVLDDAQWINSDPQAHQFLCDLWAKAEQWPLLVLANHYEQDWKKFDIHGNDSNQTPHLRSCFQTQLHETKDSVKTVFLKKIETSHCKRIVQSCFPGLTTQQVDYVVGKAAANLRFQVELLSYLSEQPHLFTNEDVRLNLTNHGFAKLQSETTDWQKFTRKRLAALDHDIRTTLFICAAQGVRFIDHLAESVATELREHSDQNEVDRSSLSIPEAIIPYTDRAENPHALISLQQMNESDSKATSRQLLRFRRIGEFRHPEYREILQQMLPEEDRQTIRKATTTVLVREWDAGRLPTNRAIVWELIVDHVGRDPKSKTEAKLRSRALVAALSYFHLQEDFWAARSLSSELMQVIRQFKLEVPSLTDPQTLASLAKHLRDAKAFEDAQTIASEMISHYKREEFATLDSNLAAVRQKISAWYTQLGDAEIGLGQTSLALEHYEKSALLDAEFLNGEKEQWQLEKRAISFEKIGDALYEMGQYKSALEAHSSCLAARANIVTNFDESVPATVLLLAAFYRLGDCHYERNDFDLSLGAYEAGVLIQEGLYPECQELPEILREAIVLNGRTGRALMRLGRLDEAETAFRKSLKASKKVLKVRGDSPQSRRDLSTSTEMLAVAQWDSRRLKEARMNFGKVLSIRESILEDFGKNHESLRDVFVSRFHLCMIACAEGDASALSTYLDSALSFARCLPEAFTTHYKYPADLGGLMFATIKEWNILDAKKQGEISTQLKQLFDFISAYRKTNAKLLAEMTGKNEGASNAVASFETGYTLLGAVLNAKG